MSSRIEKISERFKSDTAEHKLAVIRDEGVYRHLRFSKPGSRSMRVDVITWPGHLAYAGDMGSFVFSRTLDMFEFFRGTRINPEYWAQKVEASDRDGVTEWSWELFEEVIRDDFRDYLEGLYSADLVDLKVRFEDELIIGLTDKSRERAYSDAMNFEHDGRLPFQDFWDAETDIYTHRFLWCCLALVRVISLYDDGAFKEVEG